MAFSLEQSWVWDFWFADDGRTFHMFYLHAPKSLVDPELRHRNAVIGHATSEDLTTWIDLGPVLGPGASGAFDETATWTGSVIKGPDEVWRMFYTGSRFLGPETTSNIETVGVATSRDLHHWRKAPRPIVEADARLYEKLGDSSWPEEAWRDPWVYQDQSGVGWHMLITARSRTGADESDRGVIGHATSPDLETWIVRDALSQPGAGFKHLEVPQLVHMDGRDLVLFSCDSPALTGSRQGDTGGIWWFPVTNPNGQFDTRAASLLTSEETYSGRLIQNRAGEWKLLAFENKGPDGVFTGSLSDPVAVAWTEHGLEVNQAMAVDS